MSDDGKAVTEKGGNEGEEWRVETVSGSGRRERDGKLWNIFFALFSCKTEKFNKFILNLLINLKLIIFNFKNQTLDFPCPLGF